MVKKIAATEELKEKLANARAKSDAIANTSESFLPSSNAV